MREGPDRTGMPTKGSGPGRFAAVDEFDGGVGWIAHPEETMQRTSHALVEDGEVWLVDPVDTADLDDELAELGTVVGVAVLFNYHRRDAAAIARRHDVPVSLPDGMTALEDEDVDAAVERIEERLGETGYYLREVVGTRLWQEWALFDGETLVVPESIGAADYFLAPGERVGVAPLRRLRPPRSTLGGLAPERLRCGHGAGIAAGVEAELQRALREARRTAPRLYLRHAPTLVRNLSAALR